MKVRWGVAVVLLTLPLSLYAQNVLIIESTVAAFEPGKTAPAGLEVQLKVGEILRVLQDDGQTTTLEGPYVGPLGAQLGETGFDARQASTLLDRLFGPDLVERTGLGGVRGAVAGALPLAANSPWPIPTTDSRVHCVRAPGAAPRLWRPDAERADSLLVTVLTTGISASVRWAAGDHEVAWPKAVPLHDGAMYLLRRDNSITSVNVQIRFVPRALPEDLRLALWLAASDCDTQARYFASLASP